MTKHVVDKEYLQRRPISRFEKFFNFLNSDQVIWLYTIVILVLIAAPFLFPIVGLGVVSLIGQRAFLKAEFPFFAPVTSGRKMDKFNVSPVKDKETGRTNYKSAGGIAYFGNVYGTNTQAWFSNGMLRQHLAYLATTGSGKTFTISSIGSANALVWGAGYMYIDAKADLDIIRMHQSLLWRTNRIDDLFILNYIRGSRDRSAYASDKTTNSYNLLEKGSSAQNTETMKSLMQGDNDIWAKRADALLAAILKPTHYMRDKAMINLSIPALLDYLVIETAGSLLSREVIPHEHKKELAGFIKTLPGMSGEFFKKIERGQSVQSPQVYDQWGFASMQIILVINMLAGDYADIFGVTIGEIDMEAIVLQDRVLIGLLPALEGSTESVASMGRIIMAARKGVMGQSLGERFVGSVRQNLENRPTNAPYPFINILDEVGMMFTAGEGAAAAQARGLGYSIWYSAQDVPAMKKLSEQVAKEVETVMGNTMIKVAGKIIDKETFELLSNLADVEYVWQRDGLELDYNPNTGTQAPKESRASYSEQKRLDIREVQRLREGEMYINAVDRLHRIDGPNLHPKSLKTLLINDFWMMLPYSDYEIRQANNDWVSMSVEYDQIISGELKLKEPPPPALQEIKQLAVLNKAAKRFCSSEFSASLAALSTYILTNVDEMAQLNQSYSNNVNDYYNAVEDNPESEDQFRRLAGLAPNIDPDSPSAVEEFKVSPSQPEVSMGAEQAVQNNDANVSEQRSDSEFEIRESKSKSTESNEAVAAKIQSTDEAERVTNAIDMQHAHALDAAFAAHGMDKESVLDSMATISALSSRASTLKMKIEAGELTREQVKNQMLDGVSENEKNSHVVRSTATLSHMYQRTSHPHDPTPVSDKRLALSILKRMQHRLGSKEPSNV